MRMASHGWCCLGPRCAVTVENIKKNLNVIFNYLLAKQMWHEVTLSSRVAFDRSVVELLLSL